MVAIYLTETQLKRMAVAKEKKRGVKPSLILTVPHQGAVIIVTKETDTATTIKGSKRFYPILAQVWVFFADRKYRNGKYLKGYHLEHWDDYAFTGKTRSSVEINAALTKAKKKAYVLAGKIAHAGYKFKR